MTTDAVCLGSDTKTRMASCNSRYLNDSNLEFTSGVTIDKSGNYIMSSISMQKFPKSGQTYKAVVDSFDQCESAEIVSKKLEHEVSKYPDKIRWDRSQGFQK